MQIPAKKELMQRFVEFLSSQKFNKKYRENKKATKPYKTAQE